MENFRDVLVECELGDLGFRGSHFTWCSNREGNYCILERLDHFLANFQWRLIFPHSDVRHGYIGYFDHCLISIGTEGVMTRGNGPRPFRFEEMWIGDEGCRHVIEMVWNQREDDNLMEGVLMQISQCRQQL